jgi:hypothetical protein
MPRSTEHYIHQRALALRQEAARYRTRWDAMWDAMFA